MIRAVIFDIGGVLVRTEDQAPRRKWERRFGMKDRELADLVFNSPASRRASVGRATSTEVWAEVKQKLSLTPAELEELKTDFWRGDVWDTGLIRYVVALRPRFKTGIISNAWPDARENVKPQIDESAFDVIVFSGEEGLEKPQPGIYRRALERLRVQPPEAIFVDDMRANIEGAQAVGMFGVHFTDPAKARAEIERLINDQVEKSHDHRTQAQT